MINVKSYTEHKSKPRVTFTITGSPRNIKQKGYSIEILRYKTGKIADVTCFGGGGSFPKKFLFKGHSPCPIKKWTVAEEKTTTKYLYFRLETWIKAKLWYRERFQAPQLSRLSMPKYHGYCFENSCNLKAFDSKTGQNMNQRRLWYREFSRTTIVSSFDTKLSQTIWSI